MNDLQRTGGVHLRPWHLPHVAEMGLRGFAEVDAWLVYLI